MEELDALRRRIKALEDEGLDPDQARQHTQALREGLDRLGVRMEALQQAHGALNERRESLAQSSQLDSESQVMDIILEREVGARIWDNVIPLPLDDFDPDGKPAA